VAHDGDALLPGEGPARAVLECLRTRGALFYRDLVGATGRLRIEVEEGLWDLVSRGLVTADGFGSVRALLTARERWAKRAAQVRGRRLRRGAGEGANVEGRWSLLPTALSDGDEHPDRETLAEAVAEQLLARYGVVFRDLMARETFVLPWREILWALRRLEARGSVRGGRFVTGFVGEQYALPEAVELLRQTRRRERTGEVVRVSAVDPLNLVGILTPGPRIPATRGNIVVYRDGLPVPAAGHSRALTAHRRA
jgi:ATP-dependent helicase Lhr and Lhr-like helicase